MPCYLSCMSYNFDVDVNHVIGTVMIVAGKETLVPLYFVPS